MELEPPAGGRQRFVETSKQGKVRYEVVSQVSPVQQVVGVVDEGQPFGGTWIWDLVATSEGTRLTITENGYLSSPFFRTVARAFVSPTATLQTYLQALAAVLGNSWRPVIMRRR